MSATATAGQTTPCLCGHGHATVMGAAGRLRPFNLCLLCPCKVWHPLPATGAAPLPEGEGR